MIFFHNSNPAKDHQTMDIKISLFIDWLIDFSAFSAAKAMWH